MTEYLLPPVSATRLLTRHTSQGNNTTTEDHLNPAPSSSVQMNRTGSAEVTSLPESPFATSKSAAAGIAPNPGHRSVSRRSAGVGIAASPLIATNRRLAVGGYGASLLQADNEVRNVSSSYDLFAARSSTNMIPADDDLLESQSSSEAISSTSLDQNVYEITNATTSVSEVELTRSGMQTVAEVKKERTAIQVSNCHAVNKLCI